jgi:hypothetical protein
VTRCSDVTTSIGGKVSPGRGKREDNVVGLTRILLDQKIKKIHAVDSAGTNGR